MKMQNSECRMQNYKVKIILFIISFIILNSRFLILNSIAHAESLALSISPSILEVMIKPGKSITQLYKLTNNAEKVIVTPRLLQLGENGIIEDDKYEREKWISILSNDIEFDKPFILEENKQAEFLLKISPPAETDEKDYYRVLVFTTTPNLATDTTMTSFVQNLAAPVLLNVTKTGILQRSAQIIRFDVPKVVDSFDAFRTNIYLKNTGSNYFRPTGKITLAGPIGRGSTDIIPQAILSGQTKKLVTGQEPPSNLPEQTLYLPGFYLGKYTVDLTLALDEGNNTIKEVKTFYAIPWKAGVFLLVVGLVLSKSLRLLKPNKKKDGQ